MAGPRGCAVRQFLRIAFPKEVSARHLQQVGSELQGLVSYKTINTALPDDDIIIPQSQEESQSRIENARIIARARTKQWFGATAPRQGNCWGRALRELLSLARREGRGTETRRFPEKHFLPPNLLFLRVLRRRPRGWVVLTQRTQGTQRGKELLCDLCDLCVESVIFVLK